MATPNGRSGLGAAAQVVKLRGTNDYDAWKRQMPALLLGQDLRHNASSLTPHPTL
jgi:hypothetical protein